MILQFLNALGFNQNDDESVLLWTIGLGLIILIALAWRGSDNAKPEAEEEE